VLQLFASNEDALLISGVKAICEMRNCLHVHCPDCRLVLRHMVFDSLVGLPSLEPLGSELRIPGIPEPRDEQTRCSESTEDKTLYDPSNDLNDMRERIITTLLDKTCLDGEPGGGMQKKVESKRDGRMECQLL
jgi:hypothetical protein